MSGLGRKAIIAALLTGLAIPALESALARPFGHHSYYVG